MTRAFAAGLAITGAAGSACGTTAAQCECGDPAVHVVIPASRAADAIGVTLSGRGCATATAQCVTPAGSGCAEYVFEGTGVGTCDVDVKFQANPADYDEQVTFGGIACCPAYYLQPPSSSPIVVPDAPGDAGSAG